jgi:hypothetical protein
MSRRPNEFPDYESPPVVEVVCGVQFNPIDRILCSIFSAIINDEHILTLVIGQSVKNAVNS